jgi:nitronate monooxygenase
VRTRLGEVLGVEHPILNAPMGLGVATPELAAAVSEAGGLGLIGGSLLFRSTLQEAIARARELTDRPFGVGFISHLDDAGALAAAALAEGVPVVAHSFADPTPFVAPAHDAGAVVISQVRRVDEAEQAAEAGVDVVVAQGTEAGGHTGLVSTLPLVPAVVDAVAPLPVIAAGGIADARGIAAALLLGADGVWMGTRFLATPEAGSRSTQQERFLAAGPGDTVLTDVFDVAGGLVFPPDVHTRVVRNDFTDRWHGREEELAAWTEEERAAWIVEGLGTADEGVLAAGEGVGLVHEVEPAGTLVARLVSETDRLLLDRPDEVLR